MINFKSTAIKTFLALSLLTSVQSQASNLCDGIFTGEIERIRVQEQASGETTVRVFIYPGYNADYAGYATSDFLVDAIFKSKADKITVTGYSDASCKIKWIDVK